MRSKYVVAGLALALMATLSLTAMAAGKSTAKPATIKGEILDLACFTDHGAKGPDHAECAKMCAKGGQPMGLLAEDGTVYVLTAPHDDMTAYNKAKDLAGQKVEIKGMLAEHGGIKGLAVQEVKAI